LKARPHLVRPRLPRLLFRSTRRSTPTKKQPRRAHFIVELNQHGASNHRALDSTSVKNGWQSFSLRLTQISNEFAKASESRLSSPTADTNVARDSCRAIPTKLLGRPGVARSNRLPLVVDRMNHWRASVAVDRKFPSIATGDSSSHEEPDRHRQLRDRVSAQPKNRPARASP